ncbi:hypothetical protein ADUPG1_009001, partial [Aduncisulcus paluster]
MSSSTDAVIQTVEPEFVHEEDCNEVCCPIPRDSPNIKSTEFSTIKAIDGTKEEGGYDKKYDQSSDAQKMMKGEYHAGHFTHISIPFFSSSPMKGAYICLLCGFSWTSPPSHLIFTFTSLKGEKTSMKYEFPEFEEYRWYFLPVDLPDVVLCEITGKGREEKYFGIESLLFIGKETPEEIKAHGAREKLWSETPVVKSEFVKEGDEKSEGRDSIPIPRDDPKLVNPSFSMVKCKNDVYGKESEEYDESSRAQQMLKGECTLPLSHLSIPFSSPNPMKGAYICVHKNHSSPFLLFTFTDYDRKKTSKKYEFTRPKHGFEWHFLPIDLDNVVLCEIEGKGMWCNKNMKGAYIQLGEAINLDLDSRPSNLIFTFTTSNGEKISKRYDFPGFRYSESRYCWYFLPVDLSDVMLCEITGKGRKKEHFSIISLMFIREETREETIAREAREITLARCWSQAPVVKSEFIKEGDWETWKESIPIPRDDPKVINPSFSMVKCKDDSHYMESRLYDKSLDAQLMLKGEDCVIFSHLSIPFPQSNPMKGAYICVNLHCGSPSLLFTFTDCDGKKTSKRYEFIRPKYTFEWHFISIDLPNVVLCEIEGKEMRIEDKYHRSFAIYSLVFIRDDDIPTSLPHLLPGTSSSSKKLS